ncbi:unnamed protein product [Brassica rapa subsp. trilocularis]
MEVMWITNLLLCAVIVQLMKFAGEAIGVPLEEEQ